eukprot:GSChrysophyteH2.ASY1.ANO1.977.1 assembled CDS
MRNEFIYKRLYNNQDLLDIADNGYRGPSKYPHLQPDWVSGGPSGAGGGPNVNNTPYGTPEDAVFSTAEEWLSKGGTFDYCPQRLMTIVDVNNISVSDINTDMISFLRQTAEIGDQYYPEVVSRLVIVNAPYWFETIWRMVNKVLPVSVQEKIKILHGVEGLSEFVDKEQLPPEYGGTNPIPLGQSTDHKAWVALTEDSSRSGTGSLEREDYENQKELEGSSSNSRAQKGSSNSGNSGNDDEQGSGWLGWWRRGMKGPAEAHLGSKSPYSYDQEAGRWVMGISDYQMQAHNNEESGLGLGLDRSRMTDEKLEEHGLVLAIQAAHVASTLGKANASPRGKSGKGGNVSRWGRQTPTSPRLAVPPSWGGDGNVVYATYAHLQEHVALLKVTNVCGAMFWFSSIIFAGLICVIPVWLMSPIAVGGRGYSVLDLGCVFSCSGLIGLQCHAQARWRLRRVAQVSPVRALRIAAGTLSLSLFCLSFCGSEATWLPSGFGGDEFVFRPSNTMFAVPLPALFITFTLWAAHYLRQATECLYLLTRRQLTGFEWENARVRGDENGPEFDLVPYLVAVTADLVGPIFMSWLMSITHASGYEYPMDSGFFLPVSASMAFMFYMGSLLLSLQFVGDFGIIPDDPVHEAGMGALGDFYLLLGHSARSSESTFVGSRLFNLNLSMSKELKEV